MLSATTSPGDLQIDLVDNSVRFQAERRSTLGGVAGPLVAWWQGQGFDTALRLVAAGGDLRINFIAGESAVEIVRHFIETESGSIRGIDENDADEHPARRIPSRRSRRGFTARVVGITDDEGVLSVGVAEHPDGTGRSLILQGVDPACDQADLLEPGES
jgi:hypothetical protein